MFEKLYAEDSVECGFQVRVGEFESCNVACDDFDVLEFLLLSLGVDIIFLSPRVGESHNSRIGEYLGQVEAKRAPTTAAPRLSQSHSSSKNAGQLGGA